MCMYLYLMLHMRSAVIGSVKYISFNNENPVRRETVLFGEFQEKTIIYFSSDPWPVMYAWLISKVLYHQIINLLLLLKYFKIPDFFFILMLFFFGTDSCQHKHFNHNARLFIIL